MLTQRPRSPSVWHQLVVIAICVPFLLLADGPAGAGTGESGDRVAEATRKLQDLLDDVAGRLALSRRVRIGIVAVNPFLLSVEPPAAADEPFVVAIEAKLIDQLSPDELRAALAHELGHVWIYTHHPYLQTERLANEVAMRVVTRDALAAVYLKIWQQSGKKGDLEAFLGD